MDELVYVKKEKKQLDVAFALLPYWTPLIPPFGLANMKGYLNEHNYKTKIFDANIDKKFVKILSNYFNILKKAIPENAQGNLINVGNDLMANHLMMHYNLTNQHDYESVVKDLVYKTYNFTIDSDSISELRFVVDNFFDQLEQFIKRIISKYDITNFGFTVYRGTVVATLYAAEIIKRLKPEIKVIIGGAIFSQELPIGTPDFERFLNKADNIDKIFIGEGELLMLDFLKGKLDDSKKIYELRDVYNERVDINKMVLADFSDLDLNPYTYLPSYTSRSCPFQCSFCAETVYWGKYNKRKTEVVVEELTNYKKQYSSNLFLFCDSLLNPTIDKLSDAFLKNDMDIYWDGYLRIDKTCTVENTNFWRKAGFYRARLGVESGSQKILDAMEKKIDIELIKKSIINLAKSGTKTTTYWIVGYPGETEEDFQETLDLIEELKDYLYEAEANPFRYYYAGQSNSDGWGQEFDKKLLFPDLDEYLNMRTWTLDTPPFREEVIDRLTRFSNHCKSLEIPNPYSLWEIYHADERWKALHESSVPSIVELKQYNSF